jgi:hypothetical protein
MNDYLTFIHRFSRTVSCTARIKDEPLPPGQNVVFNFEWTGKPKPKHLTAYRQWALFLNQTVADRWGQTILYALGTASDETELWTFKPGQAPKLAKRLNVGIP